MLKMAEISSGRSLKPNIPRELKLGYALWLQGLKNTPGNAAGGKGLRGVHNEIHTIRKPSEALLGQVFQVVAKSNQRAKGWQRAYFVFRPVHKGHIRSPKSTVPPGRGTIGTHTTSHE